MLAVLERNYVVVKYDVDRGNGPDVWMQYGGVALPTILLVSPDGESVNRYEGVPEGGSQQLADWLANGVTQALPTAMLEARIKEKADDAVALLGLAGRYKKDKRDADAAAMLRRAVEADATDKLGVASEAAWQLGLIENNGKNGQFWFEWLGRYLQTFAKAPRAQTALDWLTSMPELQQPGANEMVRPVVRAYLQANATDASRLRRLVYAAVRCHSDDVAIDAARKLVEVDPTGQSRSDLASCLAGTGKRDEGMKVCQEALAGAKADDERKAIERRLQQIRDGAPAPELAAVRGAPWTKKK